MKSAVFHINYTPEIKTADFDYPIMDSPFLYTKKRLNISRLTNL